MDEAAREAFAYSEQLGHRIKICRGNGSRDEFARLLQIHANTVGKFERGETMPDAFTLTKIATIGDRSAQWLLTGVDHRSNGVEKSLKAVDCGGFVYVPHFDIQASAGNGIFNDIETIIAMRPFDSAYIRGELGIHHNELALVTVVGRSMEPQLHTRDTVMLDLRACDVLTEGIHAILMDGALLIKKVQRLPGRTLRVSSANSEFGSFDIVGSDEDANLDFSVVGRARWGGITFN